MSEASKEKLELRADLYYQDQSGLASQPARHAYDEFPSHQVSQGQQASRRVLSRRDILLISAAFLIGLVCIILNFRLQADLDEMNQAVASLKDDSYQLQQQTNKLNNEIIEQYDYDLIKETAREEGMVISRSRVRNVGE